MLTNNAPTYIVGTKKINEEHFNYVLDILDQETLCCPPPYDFTHEDFIRECPRKAIEDAGGKWDCRICWEKYVLA